MSFVAWAVFGAFLAYVVWDGLRRTQDAHDLEGYYAGGRRIPWWAAGLSVMATQASAITVIGTTGQGHEGGMGFLQIYLGLPFAMILLCVFLIPLYRSQPILTAYEYLERRFNPETRALGSLVFLVSRCAALGVVIYGPAVVLSAMTGLGLTATVLIIGAITTIYTTFGGINAVVWTDVKQMTVILFGLALVLVVLLVEVLRDLDLGQALSVLGAAGKLNALEVVPASTEFLPRAAGSTEGAPSFWEQSYNLWSGLFGGLFLSLAYFGCDQSQVQRILTNPTANESRKAMLLSAFAKVPMQFFVLLIGVLLYLFHALHSEPLLFIPGDAERAKAPRHAAQLEDLERRFEAATAERRELLLEIAALDDHPRSDPALLGRYRAAVREAAAVRSEAARAFSAEADAKEAAARAEGASFGPADRARYGEKNDTNYIFPHFILNHLHPILLGLILAAIFAAAMSSVDSVLNSLSAATIVDFYKRWVRPNATDAQNLLAGRIATLFWGLSATFAALFFIGGGSIIEQINRIGSFFYGTLLGGFALAILIPRAGGWAGFLGLLGGMGSVIAVHRTLEVEYLWYNVIGCAGVLLVGWLASFVPQFRARA